MIIPDPGHPTPRRWKRLRPPSSEGEGGEVGLCEVCTWGRLEPAVRGNRRRAFFPAGQSSRRGWCAGTGPLFEFSLHACVDMDRHVFVIALSAPPPPPPGVYTQA